MTNMVQDVQAIRIQCDAIWSFCHAKAKIVATDEAASDGAGDVWTSTAIDADSKLMVSYFVGDRGAESTMILMDDLCARLANRVQLTTEGHALALYFAFYNFCRIHKSLRMSPRWPLASRIGFGRLMISWQRSTRWSAAR